MIKELGKRAEVYTQDLRSVGMRKKKNVYSYFRSKDGPGQECNFIAAPLDYKPTITHVMTFLETLYSRQPDWQSKDLLVLFYPESDYSLSVKEFVDSYYSIDGARRIEGRCGYLRQGFPFVIKDYDFTKVSLMVDGINS